MGIEDVTMDVVHQAMHGLAARQRAIADNVANINTPGFLAGKVDFESALRSALDSGGPVDPSAVDVTPSVARSLEPTREDGNNVNLDEETLSNSETGLRYSLMLRAQDNEFALLRSSMRSA